MQQALLGPGHHERDDAGRSAGEMVDAHILDVDARLRSHCEQRGKASGLIRHRDVDADEVAVGAAPLDRYEGAALPTVLQQFA